MKFAIFALLLVTSSFASAKLWDTSPSTGPSDVMSPQEVRLFRTIETTRLILSKADSAVFCVNEPKEANVVLQNLNSHKIVLLPIPQKDSATELCFIVNRR